MRIIPFYLPILFCLSTQFANASENITITKIGIAAAGAVTIWSAYSWYSHSTQKNTELNKKHQERLAQLKSLRAAQAQEDSDDNGIGSTCYVE